MLKPFIVHRLYKQGRRVRLIYMHDEKLSPNLLGTILHVDDVGTIHVAWDNGATLGLIQDKDLFELVE
ncbi:DUF4314 domain-containing protein (plasmid) [Vibrio sp. SS-MA-C1-2]|uniref:DUF4314 domain-containing protein n=1 Tax=Vibrio sp. SS-MA-C1-2 TaxID=2908646 RepID=UPI001F35FD53|nr:DUF4314 domain-containing protein [Vibrio sp. SS-MA-C1-2]UJF20224.1 DUF4314 domain-containing protein [Vibrio sp. SS-MA-C1-2]